MRGKIILVIGGNISVEYTYESAQERQDIIDSWWADKSIERDIYLKGAYMTIIPEYSTRTVLSDKDRIDVLRIALKLSTKEQMKILARSYGISVETVYNLIKNERLSEGNRIICTKCYKQKPEEEFHFKLGKRRKDCKECRNALARQYRRKYNNKQLLVNQTAA